MANKYIGKCGNVIGQSNDEITIMAEDAEEALVELLGYSVDGWPASDSDYSAVCWIENEAGDVLASEDVTIGADGSRSLSA